MVPISQEFNVPLTSVAFVLSVPLWLRLGGAIASGWLADQVGRKIPLMISFCTLWSVRSGHCADFPCEVQKFFFSHFSSRLFCSETLLLAIG
jgi:MFS transporter, SHS family, lactate transporter